MKANLVVARLRLRFWATRSHKFRGQLVGRTRIGAVCNSLSSLVELRFLTSDGLGTSRYSSQLGELFVRGDERHSGLRRVWWDGFHHEQ